MPIIASVTMGRIVRSVDVGGFSVSENFHAAGQALPRHAHAHASICLPWNGSFEETIFRDSYSAAPGMVLVKPAEYSHANRYGPEGVRSLLIDVSPERLEVIGQVTDVLGRPCVMDGGPWRRAAIELAQAWSENGSASPLVIEGLILELIGRLKQSQVGPTRRLLPSWLKRAHEFVSELSCEPLTLSAIAQEVGVHPVHLARSFRKHYGRSIGEYQREQRLMRAMQLLRDSDATLVEIAQWTGFADQSHFTRAFRKQFSMTPGAYRTRHVH